MDVSQLPEGTLAAGLLAVPLGIGIAAATGFRVFLPLLALGLAGRFEWVPLADTFAWLADTATLYALGVAALLEIAAYYVPGVDHLLDTLAGPAALVAGAVSVAAVTTELPPALKWTLAIVAGSGSAGLVQGAMTLLRAKSGLTTGGLANPVVATGELGGAVGLSALAIFVPVLAVVAVAALLYAAFRLGRRLWRRGAPSGPSEGAPPPA
jgi:hypothetical protein